MDTAKKISIINALMQEDRAEIRMNKSILLQTSYFAVSGVIAITAFAIAQQAAQYLAVYTVGIWSFYLLYISTFFYFKIHLTSLRKCLDIRESYYKDFNLLETEEPFNPLRPVDKAKTAYYRHDYLLFLPVVVLIVAAGNTIVLFYVM